MIDIGKDLANAYEEGMRDARAKIDNEVFELQTEVKRLECICHSYALQYGTVTDQQKVIDKAKAEVIEEIEKEIDSGRGLNFALQSLDHFIAELKKKYTEGE